MWSHYGIDMTDSELRIPKIFSALMVDCLLAQAQPCLEMAQQMMKHKPSLVWKWPRLERAQAQPRLEMTRLQVTLRVSWKWQWN